HGPLIASNRIGREVGESCEITFYGTSFIAGPTGEVLAEAGRDAEAVITATVDLDEISIARRSWGMFRDRRPDLYGPLLTLDGGPAPGRTN
ncbi:MAG: nitrilase-related carbon-nitrogen hydrolase, partial [Alphaproteobacteria bacterium]